MPVKQQPWTPTTRRGPIAAEMKSPAPNSVDLPPLLGLFIHITMTFSHYYFVVLIIFFLCRKFKFTVNIHMQYDLNICAIDRVQ